MLSWESKKIGYTGLLKSTLKLAKKAISNAGIKPDEIGLIVHGGVFREHFRTEPAFATHIQGDLRIQCHGIGIDSRSCFSFDVTDGSCSPHIAIQSIADLLPALPSDYALLCIGDDRPTKHCDWEYESYCVVAVIGLSGEGPRCESISYDNSNLTPNLTTIGYFDKTVKGNNFDNAGTVEFLEQQYSKNFFQGHQNWLSGKHMHEFLQLVNKHDDTLEHCIIDRSGKSTTAKWVL